MKIKEKTKKNNKQEKGVTLLALVIIIIVLLILSSVAIYSGIQSINSAKLTLFTTELKIMQTQVNNLYDKMRNKETITVDGVDYIGSGDEEKKEQGIQDIGDSIYVDEIKEQAIMVLNTVGIDDVEKDNFRYYDTTLIKEGLGINGITQELLVNVVSRQIISYKGLDFDGKIYYTLEQLPDSLYNVNYQEPSGQPTFNVSVKNITPDERWEIEVSNIAYEGYIGKWQVKYQLEDTKTPEQWDNSDNLSFIVKKTGSYKIIISNGNISSQTPVIVKVKNTNLPSTEETTPYLIDDDSEVLQKDIDKGIVVKDKKDNEWVWIEVPKSLTAKTTNDTEIEQVLQTYSGEYKYEGGHGGETSWKDEWYDGCGLSLVEYNEIKSKMLRSIKENGGFYIGRYETGTNINRKNANDQLTVPVIKQDMYVYNFVTVAQSQNLSKQINTEDKTTSLPFGIQKDLIYKFIEVKKGKTIDELKIDSTNWGNYYNSSFNITKGKYSLDRGGNYTNVNETYTKPISEDKNQGILLTTGATERNSVLNIFDLAGNIDEVSLEHVVGSVHQVSSSGGYFILYTGSEYPASNRAGGNISGTTGAGFRTVLF